MKKYLVLILSLITLFLEIMPWGAVLNFGQPDGEVIRKTYSYFSLVPYGYANFFPLMTGILSALFVFVFILSFFKEKWEKSAFYLSFGSAILSILPIIQGIRNFSVVGFVITLLLVASTALLWKKDYLK